MKIFTNKVLTIILLAIFFQACEKKELEENVTINNSDIDSNELNSFWETNKNPSEEELDAYYDKMSKSLESVVLPEDVDLSLLHQVEDSGNNKFVLSTIASEVVSWGSGKALDKIFSNSSSGDGSSSDPASLTKVINELNKDLNRDYNTIIALLRDLKKNPQITQMLDGKSLKDEGINAMKKGEYTKARNKFASALSKFRTATPYGFMQYLPTLILLNECNRKLAKNRNQFYTNMNRTAIEAKSCFDTFTVQNVGEENFQNSAAKKDQVITSILMRSKFFEKKSRRPPTGNVTIDNVRELDGFLIGPKHSRWRSGKGTFNLKVKGYNRFAIVRSGYALKTPKSVGFGGNYQYLKFGAKKQVTNGDYKFRLVPYGNGGLFFMSVNVPKATDQRHFKRYNDNRGNDLFGLASPTFGSPSDRRNVGETLMAIRKK